MIDNSHDLSSNDCHALEYFHADSPLLIATHLSTNNSYFTLLSERLQFIYKFNICSVTLWHFKAIWFFNYNIVYIWGFANFFKAGNLPEQNKVHDVVLPFKDHHVSTLLIRIFF
jgi:hypothetical protein